MSAHAAPTQLKPNRLAAVSMFAAGLMMAHQVAGKAARDSIYLSTFPVSDLPKAVMAAAAAALLLTFISARAMSAYGPRRVVPAGFLLSAFAHAVEWSILDNAPGATAVLVYLHIVGLGAVLLSGFWSVANETFDPASAKQLFGRIAGGGTAGGILGGLIAERTAVLMPGAGILLVLAAFHLLTAITLAALGRMAGVWSAPARGGSLDESMSPAEVLRRAPFLRDLALLVLLGTLSAAFVDYLFKAGAASSFGKGAPLLRFFAVFYTSIQVITLIVQTLLTRLSLVKLGLSRTVGGLPLVNSVMAGAGLLFPVFPVFAAARASEYTIRGSLFRSGYELLYTPVAPAEKRAAKSLIDVAADRAGDAIGAGIIQILLMVSASFLTTELLGLTMAASLAAAWIASRLDNKYAGALERRLLDHAVELDMEDIHDSTTMSAVLRTRTLIRQTRQTGLAAAASKSPPPLDDGLAGLAALRSGKVETVLASLRRGSAFDTIEYPQAVRLLAWDPVADEARKVLERAGTLVTGLLSDHLLAPGVDFSIRRRIPRILARHNSQRAFDALLQGLSDSRFEVRYQCARALDYMHSRNPLLLAPRDLIFRIVAGELGQGQAVLESRQLIDQPDEEAALAFMDLTVGGAADKNAEFIVSLLATILPREPLRVAFQAFHSPDRLLHGLAVEYFDSVLEGEAREAFRRYVHQEAARPRREPQSIMNDLLASGDSMDSTASGGDARP